MSTPWRIGDYVELSFCYPDDASKLVVSGIGLVKSISPYWNDRLELLLIGEVVLAPGPCPDGYELGNGFLWPSRYCLKLDPGLARQEIVRREIKDMVI
jgi:hypothetical protein